VRVTGASPALAGFDVSLAISATGAVPVVLVNSGTAPPGLLPGQPGYNYNENGITAYLPLKTASLGRNESALGAAFLAGQGSDGVLPLKNENTASNAARLAFIFQSPEGTSGVSQGALFDIYMYTGLSVPGDTQVELRLGGPPQPLLAAFGDAAVPVGQALAGTSRIFALGDVNHDQAVDLADAILVLKVISGASVVGVHVADVDRDGGMGTPEVVHVMHKVAGIR
jgi:hypothetical protein